MSKQPEAIRLADDLDELDRQFSRNGLCGDAAYELRRLHAERNALLEALTRLYNTGHDSTTWNYAMSMASSAIANATGEQQ